MGGVTDVLGEFPLDGADNEGWRENGLRFGGLIGSVHLLWGSFSRDGR